jgi:hypothetical protein
LPRVIDKTHTRSSRRHARCKKEAARAPLALDNGEHFRIAHTAEAFDEIVLRDRITAGGQQLPGSAGICVHRECLNPVRCALR